MTAPPRETREGPPDRAIYGGADPFDFPRYTFRDVARATGVPATTIGAWVRGQFYEWDRGAGFFEPVIGRPDGHKRLSFNNILETHVVRALRTVDGVKLRTIREAQRIAEQRHGIQRLLISPHLVASGGDLLLESMFGLVHLTNTEQFAMREVLKTYLRRVRVDAIRGLSEFYPIPRGIPDREATPVLVSPLVSFGSPVVRRVGVTTYSIAKRFNAGESKQDVTADYGLTDDEFEEAILYELAA